MPTLEAFAAAAAALASWFTIFTFEKWPMKKKHMFFFKAILSLLKSHLPQHTLTLAHDLGQSLKSRCYVQIMSSAFFSLIRFLACQEFQSQQEITKISSSTCTCHFPVSHLFPSPGTPKLWTSMNFRSLLKWGMRNPGVYRTSSSAFSLATWAAAAAFSAAWYSAARASMVSWASRHPGCGYQRKCEGTWLKMPSFKTPHLSHWCEGLRELRRTWLNKCVHI